MKKLNNNDINNKINEMEKDIDYINNLILLEYKMIIIEQKIDKIINLVSKSL